MTEESFQWSQQSLNLLYRINSALCSANTEKQIFHDLLLLLQQYTTANAGLIQLITDEGLMALISSIGINDKQISALQHTPINGQLFNFETNIFNEIKVCDSLPAFEILAKKQLCIPIRYKVQTLGAINLFIKNEIEITEERAYLLLSVGAHLGELIQRSTNEQASRRQLIKDERTIIANELHDSLAQTLASLRFQIRILDQSLQPIGSYMTTKTLESVEHGLDEATHSLRELIAHCRAPIDEQGLLAAINRAVEKFRNETKTHILLQCNHHINDLPSNIEINAYRIVQEALNNIKKHANAKIVRVLITCKNEEHYRILIENDGKGFIQDNINSSNGKHIGLHIMQERAQHINGHLKIESELDEGTRIELKFRYKDTHGNS